MSESIKYEYLVVYKEKFFSSTGTNQAKQEQEWLNELGELGWELIFYQQLYGDNDLYKFKKIKTICKN